MSLQRPVPSLQRVVRFGLVAAVIATTGVICATVIGFGAAHVIDDRHFGFGALGIVIAAIMAAYPFGAIAGLFLLRRKPGVAGSLLTGILGCVIGALLTMLLAGALNVRLEPSTLIATYFISVPALGAFGYLYGHRAIRNTRHRSDER